MALCVCQPQTASVGPVLPTTRTIGPSVQSDAFFARWHPTLTRIFSMIPPGLPQSAPEPFRQLPQFLTRIPANGFSSPVLWNIPQKHWPGHNIVSGSSRVPEESNYLSWRTLSANTFEHRGSSIDTALVCNMEVTLRLWLFTGVFLLSRTQIATSSGITVWREIWA